MSSQRYNLALAVSDPGSDTQLGVGPPGPLTSIARHKLLAATLFLGVLALTTAVILFYPRQYHSVGKLLLRIGRENVTLDPTASGTGETLNVTRTRESEVATALEMMASREIIREVVDRFSPEVILSGSLPGGEEKPPSLLGTIKGSIKKSIDGIDPISVHEKAIVSVEGDLRISAPSDAGVVTIEYRTDTPELAQKVTEAWIDVFQTQYVTATRTRGALEFFEEQDRLLNQELGDLREELKQAKNKYGLITVDGQQRMLEEQMQTVRLEQLAADAQLVEVKTRIAALAVLAESIDEKTITQNVKGLPNESRDRMRSQLYDLEVEEKRLSSLYTATHPRVVAVREQLAQAAKVVEALEGERQEVTEGINPTRQAIDERLALERAEERALSKKSTTLQTQSKQLAKDLSQLNEHEQIVADLDRRLEIIEERRRVHSHRFEEARLDRALERERICSVNVVQQPTLEHRPVTPQKKLCAAFGIVAALAGAIGLPLWIESGKSAKMARVNVAALTNENATSPNGAEKREAAPALPR